MVRRNRRTHTELSERNDERAHWAANIRARAEAVWDDNALAQLARGKTLLLNPREDAQLFFALGILHRDGSMPPANARKFYQVNHMVASIGPSLERLAQMGAPIRLVDAACGSSYLSLAATTYLKRALGAQVEMVAFDRNEKVVEAATARVYFAGLEDQVKTLACDAADFSFAGAWNKCFGCDVSAPLDGVLALHACDVASDHALALALRSNAGFAAVAPCCQAELAAKMRAESGDAVLSRVQLPHVRRELGALMTNLMRVAICNERGYETTALEFVPTEHSAKNTLIRALHPRMSESFSAPKSLSYAELERLCGAGIVLPSLLGDSLDATVAAPIY